MINWYDKVLHTLLTDGELMHAGRRNTDSVDICIACKAKAEEEDKNYEELLSNFCIDYCNIHNLDTEDRAYICSTLKTQRKMYKLDYYVSKWMFENELLDKLARDKTAYAII